MCDVDTMPGGDGALKYPTRLNGGMSVVLSCPSGQILSNMKSFQMVHCKHGVWSMKSIPDCVRKNICIITDIKLKVYNFDLIGTLCKVRNAT